MGGPGRRRSEVEAAAVMAELARVLGAQPDVRWAYLFGSAARGVPFRDVDVAIQMDVERARGTRLGQVAAALEHALKDMPVDVLDLVSASPVMRARVVYEGRLLLDRAPEERKGWEVDTIRRWLDLSPWVERGERLRLEALREGRP